jgi:hypothetical protein
MRGCNIHRAGIHSLPGVGQLNWKPRSPAKNLRQVVRRDHGAMKYHGDWHRKIGRQGGADITDRLDASMRSNS